jgi:hypothetical protein
MATYDDNIQQAARKRLGLAGAINGTDDTSQSIYRPKPAQPSIAAPPAPEAAANDAAPPATAYSRGQATGQAIGAGTQYAGGVLKRVAQSTFQPALSIAGPVAQFARGVVGADPDKPLLSPISSANAAAPTPTPAPAIPGTVAPAAQPASIAAPPQQRILNTDYGNPDSAAGYSAYGPPDNTGAKAATLARTPTFQQGADAIARNQAVLSRDVGFNQDPTYQAGQQAKSDLTSILNKDPRSPAGVAARNAQVDAQSGFGSARQRNGAYQQALGGLVGQVGDLYRGSMQNVAEDKRGQQALDTEALRGQNELANTNARSLAELNKPQYETGADGNLVRVTGTKAESVTGADKTPLAVPGKINGAYEAAASRHAAELIKAGVDPDEAEQRGLDFAQRVRSGQTGQPAEKAAGQNQKFQEGQVYKDGNGNKAKYVNGKWEPVA